MSINQLYHEKIGNELMQVFSQVKYERGDILVNNVFNWGISTVTIMSLFVSVLLRKTNFSFLAFD